MYPVLRLLSMSRFRKTVRIKYSNPAYPAAGHDLKYLAVVTAADGGHQGPQI